MIMNFSYLDRTERAFDVGETPETKKKNNNIKNKKGYTVSIKVEIN